MADNYLEKKMEDYRRNHLRRHNPVGASAGNWCLKIPKLKVLVLGEITDLIKEIMRLFSGLGCKTIFSQEDSIDGQLIAQSTGALFFPNSKDKDWTAVYDFAVGRWGGIDVILLNEPSLDLGLKCGDIENTRVISINGSGHSINRNSIDISVAGKCRDAAVASMVLFMSLPQNYCVSGRTIVMDE